jgi:hypothetical protein
MTGISTGHGLSVEVLAPNRALVFWYVYDPTGKPLSLYIDGEVRGRCIEGTAYAPNGMRFGVFDPTEVNMPVWGQVRLDFGDCTHASLRWNAVSAEYGSGELPIQRLAAPYGGVSSVYQSTPCKLTPPTGLPMGLYHGTVEHSEQGEFPAVGIVDADGTLWALETRSPICCGPNQLTIAAPEVSSAGVTVSTQVFNNGWLDLPFYSYPLKGTGVWNLSGAVNPYASMISATVTL